MIARLKRLTSLCFLAAMPVHAINYSADVGQADWRVSASPFECRVTQDIPVMGEARFLQRAGDKLRFEVEASSELPMRDNASVNLVAPAWNDFLNGREVYQFAVERRDRVRFDDALSKQLLEGLLLGYSAEIRDLSPSATRKDRVAVVPVRFRSAYREFQDCMSQLLPYNFEQIERSKITFASGGYKLSEADRELLRNVARYVKADKEVNAIYVDGHTDNVGDRNDNFELSRQRAEQVALYLIQQGVNPDFVALRYHADFYPVKPNTSASNRILNRRTTVRLAKEPSETIRDKLYKAMAQRDMPKPVDVQP